MSLEDDLRVALRERAADQPAPMPDLLAGVHDGVRRANRRRVAMIGAAAALAAVIAVPVWLADERAPRPTPPAVPSPSAGIWQDPHFELPTFPLTPGWKPSGIGTGQVGRLGTNALLSYEDSGVLAVEVGPIPGSWENEGDEDHRSTVNGRAATVRTATWFDGAKKGERYVGVRWRLADGQWVQVISFGPRTEAEVLRFARGLRPEVMPASPPPFTFGALPTGLTLQLMTESQMCFSPRPPADNNSAEGLCVSVETESPDAEEPEGVRLEVSRRPAIFAGSELRISLGNHRFLHVRADQEIVPLAPGDLVRFAEATDITF